MQLTNAAANLRSHVARNIVTQGVEHDSDPLCFYLLLCSIKTAELAAELTT
jgi:hypothetical protein